jgi:hypothetical protein
LRLGVLGNAVSEELKVYQVELCAELLDQNKADTPKEAKSANAAGIANEINNRCQPSVATDGTTSGLTPEQVQAWLDAMPRSLNRAGVTASGVA